MKLKALILALSCFSVFVHASEENELKGFNFLLSSVSAPQAQTIYNTLTTEIHDRFANNCADRAHLWSYEMYKNHGIKSGKIYLYFTSRSFNHTKMYWAFHVAPYILIDGEEYVVEKIPEIITLPNGGFKLGSKLLFDKPIKLADWIHHHTGENSCVVIDPNNPEHDRAYKAFKGSKIIKTRSENCYIRKASMYYWWPASVYHKDTKNYVPLQKFDSYSVQNACLNVMNGKDLNAKKEACSKVIGE